MSDREEERPALPRRRGGRAVLAVLALVAVVAVGVHLVDTGAWVRRPAPAPLREVSVSSDPLEELRQRVAALEQRVAALAVTPPPIAVVAETGGMPGGTASALTGRMDDLTGRLRGDEARIDAGAAGMARQSRVQAAAMALAAGQPLGDLPGAPPALARFRIEAPPTEAVLRRAFAAAAPDAAHADVAALGPWRAMQARLAALITVRRGDRVVMGSPDAVTLDAARTALEAGDLAGAIGSLDRLGPAGAAAMAPWRARARSLLEARAALMAMQLGG